MMAQVSAVGLFSELKKSMDERAALTISQAFEGISERVEAQIIASSQKIIKELNIPSLATKDDFKNFITKEDAKDFLTKEDAKNFLTKEDAKDFLTKEDAKNFLTKEDAKDFLTKEDMKNLLSKDDGKNFAQKPDLEALSLSMRLELHNAISIAKWQVLGGMAVLLFMQLAFKHFGI